MEDVQDEPIRMADVETDSAPVVDPACLDWVKAKLQLLLQDDADTEEHWLDQAWSAAAHEQPIAAFLTSVKVSRLLAVKARADDASLIIMHELPVNFHRMVYFLKDKDHFVMRHNISQLVQFGVLQDSSSGGISSSRASYRGSSSSGAGSAKGSSSATNAGRIASSMEPLLRLMGNLYLPQVAHSGSWPDAVRKDFLSYTHRFMSSLTEAVHVAQGRTVLYMPAEELNNVTAHEAARDKHLIQRLETTLMYWTRQIANVLNKQDCCDMGQRAGPLVEIEFWRSRSQDLNGISAQLENKQVSEIGKVLSLAASSYLPPFLQLKERIQQEAVAAQDNVRFLACLEGPCQQLSKATPQQITAMLPQVLNCIRIVWSLSKFYNTPERIVSLLQKLSNEIINRCCSALMVEDILTGNVLGVMEMLQQSMAAGQQYKVCFDITAAAIAVSGTCPWHFDAPIFSYMDAFLQRCTDLLEVCEAQLQFAPNAKLPVIGGTRGAEVEKNFADIQAAFQSLLGQLQGLGYNMLDIQAMQWHDDFTAFKAGVHDLEVMLENVMQLALDSTPSLPGMLELLEGFQLMAKRTAVKRAVARHTADFYKRFDAEIGAVKKHLEPLKQLPTSSPMLPQYAGTARSATCLLKRLEHSFDALMAVKHMLPAVPDAAEKLMNDYSVAHQALEQFIFQTHNKWFNTIDFSIKNHLQNNLLTQDRADRNLLSMNYDRQLLSMSQEVQHWERLRMQVPYIAMEIQAQREKYRVLRDNMLMLVHDYNKVLTALDNEERRLFADRIRALDRRIMPGVSKLNWVSDKLALEFYCKEARKHCHLADNCVTGFKAGLCRIDALCKSIAEDLLIDVEKKKLYEIAEFEAVQGRHHHMAKQRLLTGFQEIQHTLAEIHTFFEFDGEEVQREWVRFTAKIDKKVEAVLHHTVKRSLQELNRLLNGDSKTEVLPVYRVALVLERNNAVELKPSIEEIFDAVRKVCEDVMAITESLPRLAMLGTVRQLRELEERGQPAQQPPESYYNVIRGDKEHVINIVVHLVEGLATASAPIQACIEHFEKRYKKLWDQDKDAYIRRYEKANKPLSSYELDIKEYLNKEDEIQREETTANVKFLFVDCGPLKQMLTAHCQLWRNKLTTLLNSLAATELRYLHEHFSSALEMLAKTPQDLEQLAEAVAFQKRLVDDKARIAGRFEPLRDKYHVLERFEVLVPDAQVQLLDKLDGEWAKFQVGITEGANRLERSKDMFREKVKSMLEAFLRELATMQEDFTRLQPTTKDGVSSTTALAFISKWKGLVDAARQKATEVQSGMDIFSMPQPPYKELAFLDHELELLSKMWGVVSEWDTTYDGWKNGHFKELKVGDMEETAARFNKQVTKLGRDVKAWPVWGWLKNTIDAFKKTMPLITDLRNPAMRPRHWQQLMEHINAKFDPSSTQFTLESVVLLRLDQHCDFIAELSVTASKEQAIETSLANIAATWAELRLDMADYKGTYKLRSTEDIFTALEDNGVILSTMKASKYYLVFEQQVSHWERTLALASETVEMILQVQRNWMYLENIFVGSEDIRKQLPQESLMFDGVNRVFQQSMAQLQAVGNVIQATNTPNVLSTFQDMDMKLEKVQKSLDNYLESKRQQFPRFYFLSSDDLLEILGQARDPQNVQPHLKKCFEGIKRLEMLPAGSDGRKVCQSMAMYSPDGECLTFSSGLVVTEGQPEEWLNHVEKAMFDTTRKNLYTTLQDSEGMKKEKWVKDHPGQTMITAGQILWTAECEKALSDADGAKKALKLLKKKWISYLTKLTAVTCSKLDPINRNKVVALITIEVHARDVIDKLCKANCSSINDFEWVSQLRFYWDTSRTSAHGGPASDPPGNCVVKQVLSVFDYGYEYQGNNGRLVITPLTDRCYMTLGAAMYTRRGGNPLGPAGTGKTETVKDFGKALARYVIVFNCSDGVDYKMTGKMFSGLAQTGAWACLDEFNRIEVEVLSVVATQIACVMTAIKEDRKRFNFLGQEIRLIPSCAICVTMNPGYAGRSELPDNLKALLRPVSMMVPDFTLIAEILMFSEGFSSAKVLAKRMVAIMELSQQQLSKQDHYDYGLRSFVIPIARAAGSVKRVDPTTTEEVILYRTMLDLIKPKLVYLDLPLFMALLSDLFPGVELPALDGGVLRAAIEQDLRDSGLQPVPEFVTKIIQIHDCKVARHGNMIVGKTGSGKSEAWKCLQHTLGKLKTSHPEVDSFQRVHVYTINPLALSNDELYGSFEEATHEWQDGVLARIMRGACKDESPDQKWILFDGPVDTLWIESMNTTLDDNKLLTLLSGERIAMPAQVSLLFEVEDLSQASPATVSRAGMIYLNVEDMGWRPYITSWLSAKAAGSNSGATEGAGAAVNQQFVEHLTKLNERYLEAALEYKRLHCRELVRVDRLSCVRTFTRLFDALATPENGVGLDEGPDAFAQIVELWFLFSLIWGLGGSLDDEGRKKFDGFMREMDTRYPSAETVFEYHVDVKNRQWLSWDSKLSGSFKPRADIPAYRLLVPTVDTVRSTYLTSTLVRNHCHTLVVGGVGVGKTMTLQSMLETLPSNVWSSCTVNLSAQTSSNSLQDTVEGKLEKRAKGELVPAGGKHLIAFIDDLNMPKKSKFGFIPPLELLKLWVDNGFWYDRLRCELKYVKDTQLLAAMAPPGGGRNPFSQRINACFSTINMTQPNDAQLKRIFSTLLNMKLAEFDDDVRPLAEPIVAASVEIYRAVSRELLPTPSKSHYLFNTRDLAKIVLGVMQASKAFYDNKEDLLQLWVHEAFRVVGDRMWDPTDVTWLRKQIDERLSSTFSTSCATLFEDFNGEVPPYVNFLRPTMELPPYEPVRDLAALKDTLTEKLEDYALEPGAKPLDLVLFKDALLHVCRVHRVLSQPRGNALLVGVGGSGRKSLARLAAYIGELKVFSIEITNTYRLQEFREDLKGLYRLAGVAGKPTMFLFDESQIKYEVFLEDVNNILTSGEVPNLFPKDEFAAVLDELRPAAKAANAGETQEQLAAFFLERVRSNLHVVLCLSAVGEAFRERCRLFPGLVNCTTIDWYTKWPSDALYEVASRQTASVDLGSEEIKQAVCKMFVTAHQSVEATSLRMYQTLKRRSYVTPTNYLETVANYRALLSEKRSELSSKATKLKGGLTKLDETRVQVTEMKKVVQQKQVVVAQAKHDCEELLVEIVQDKRVADEQEKQVNAEATKIAKETEDANIIAAQVAAELEKALPALQEAEAALNVLTKADISELKAYSKPPPAVDMTLSGVMTVLKRPGTWEEAKKALGDANFMAKLINFDKDNMDDALLKKINKSTSLPGFNAEAVGKVSVAAKGMCLWVRAMEVYGTIAKDVAPKRARLKAAQDNVAKKKAALIAAQTQLEAVLAKVKALRDKYEESMGRKKVLEDELNDLEGKLQRAEKLVIGLAGERVRWEASIGGYENFLASLPGDALLAAAYLSYAGPFPSEFRDELVKGTWVPQVKQLNIPASESFDFCGFLAAPSTVQDWNIQGLPADSFSTANGVMVTRGRRWPLLVDPQCQAVRWIKNMEAHAGLRVMSITASDMVRQLESAVQFGQPMLLVDVLEDIDPVLEPLLAKAYVRRNNQLVVKIGDKEVDVSTEFRLYLTTKLPNPDYTPEISTKAMIVNFAVKMSGLEAQLLDTVVKHERPDLAKQKSDLVVKVAAGKKMQLQLEDTVLHLLSTATGSLLDNIELINTLDQSKTTWEEVNESLKVAEETTRQIEVASAQYRPCSARAAILYFVLNDLAATDAMYQFSLDAYSTLFHLSLSDSPEPEALADRIKALNDYHTYTVYKYASRGLFEQHKLLLSLQMCARILAASGQINAEEWQFFLQGGRVLDRSQQPPNPCPEWISEEAWDNLACLEQLPAFKGLTSSLESAAQDWELWFRQAQPEAAELPRDWEAKCNELQRLLFIRSLRPDRVIFAATTYVANAIGRQFVEPPVLDLGQALADSSPLTPLIFVLSPGVDPTDQLRKLAAEKGMADKLHTVALGQGQAPVAKRLVEDGIKKGHWVFLANCHLMTSWLPTLDKLVDGLEASKPHKNFRLWLSSNPSPAFPISLLQAGLKMTTEPPKGLRANLLRLYNGISEDSYKACKATAKYQKLLFALAYFHSVLLERRKFRTLGLNIPYDFNDTDFRVSDDLLKSYLDSYSETPWEALKYLIAEANYGGRVTDELDKRLLGSYLSRFYCEEALEIVNYKLSPLPQYFIPEPGSISSYKDYIVTLPTQDRPEAFGQHPNAEISYLIEDSKALLGDMLSLAPRTGGGSTGSSSTGAAAGSGTWQEELVEALAHDLLDQVPAPFNLEAVMKAKQDDPSALHVVLFQEIERYNMLLVSVRRSCVELVKGIKGLVVMSADLDQIFEALCAGKVPAAWLKAYPSLKGLGPWTRDLLARIEQLARWAEGTYPRIYWLGGFTYPTGFLTAVMQTTARRSSIPIDSLIFEHGVVNLDEREINGPPKEGVYVKGLFLEGGGWDFEGSCLCEPQPMELIVPMPIIHFRPVESKKKSSRGVYNCPLYMYPVRTGTRERPSYMGSVDLRAGAAESDFWIMRGTALLLSLST